jgi:hypothetical protein
VRIAVALMCLCGILLVRRLWVYPPRALVAIVRYRMDRVRHRSCQLYRTLAESFSVRLIRSCEGIPYGGILQYLLRYVRASTPCIASFAGLTLSHIPPLSFLPRSRSVS